MTDKQLDKLVSLRETRDGLKAILDSMDRDYWVEITTGNGKKLHVNTAMFDELRLFMQEQYDRACKEFREA